VGFELTDEQVALRDVVRQFAEAEIAPHAEAWDRDHAFPVDTVLAMGELGLFGIPFPEEYGGGGADLTTLCLAIEELGRWDQSMAITLEAGVGLGAMPLHLFGTEAQKRAVLPGIAAGTLIGAFALSEPDAGSDVAATSATARREGSHWRLDGVKTWISNAGLAHRYVVFARTGEAPGAKGLSAFIVDADLPGLDASQRIDVIAPHPLGTLRMDDCRVPADRLLGQPGEGFKIAMATLDVFRTTVGAAALGFARRAFEEAGARARERRMFGGRLADLPLLQAKIGEMAVAIDASSLLVYRSGWTRDVLGRRVTREASTAKLFATEAAQQVIDGAVQVFGGLGVVRGMTVERLYREIRALRIYEGASEVLKLIIGAKALADDPGRR
jgi:acyl-CoA dehydrogenase